MLQLALLSHLKDFVHQALWAKLPVGEWLAAWKLLEVICPLDGQVETMLHARFQCKFTDLAFQHIANCFPDWEAGPQLELTPQVGVLAWTAVQANWKTRNSARASPDARFTDPYFFRLWKNLLSPFATSKQYTVLSSDNAAKVIASFTPHAAVPSLPLEPPTPQAVRRQKRKKPVRLNWKIFYVKQSAFF